MASIAPLDTSGGHRAASADVALLALLWQLYGLQPLQSFAQVSPTYAPILREIYGTDDPTRELQSGPAFPCTLSSV